MLCIGIYKMGHQNLDNKYIAALDIGTTSIRCFVYDQNVKIVAVATEKVNVNLSIIFVSNINYNEY